MCVGGDHSGFWQHRIRRQRRRQCGIGPVVRGRVFVRVVRHGSRGGDGACRLLELHRHGSVHCSCLVSYAGYHYFDVVTFSSKMSCQIAINQGQTYL